MANEELLKYLHEQTQLGYAERDLHEHCVRHGWPHDEVEKAFLELKQSHPKRRGNHLVLAIILVLIAISAVLAFDIFSFQVVEKPVIDEPAPFATGQAIAAQHVEYMFNEMGAYQLDEGLL